MFDKINIPQSQLESAVDRLADRIRDLFSDSEENSVSSLYRDEKTMADVIHNIKVRMGDELELENIARLQYKIKWQGKEYKLQLPSFFDAISYVDNYDKSSLSKTLLQRHVFSGDGTRINDKDWDIDPCVSADILFIVRKLLCLD